MAQAIDTEIQTYMPYLARNERYNKEKPFGADFPVDRCEGGQCANHIFDNQAVTVHNMRGGEQPVLDRHGFCLVHAQTSLTAAEASNSRTPPMERYLGEIERILYEKFPEYLRIEIMDFQVCCSMWSKIGVKVEFEQPATVPHTDFSVSGAFMRMKDIFPGQEEHYENKSFDLINVWRVLKGPNDDWPLALCDFQSVDLDKDVTPNDCLHETGVGENWLLHANDSHRWYFMDWQEEADLIVFRNADSEGVRARKLKSMEFGALTSDSFQGLSMPQFATRNLYASRGIALKSEWWLSVKIARQLRRGGYAVQFESEVNFTWHK